MKKVFMNQLATAAATLVTNGLNEVYAYDSFGNILQNGSFTASYTLNNQMFRFAYDAAGNLLSNGITPLTWDAESRLSSDNGATYIYDANGDRVEKQGVGVTDTIYFGGQPIARFSAGQWTDLVYGPTGLLAEVPGIQAGAPMYRVTDHLGTTVGNLTASGAFVNPLDYAPFGRTISGNTTDPYQFTGKERDTESGLDYFGARYYGSSMGRFMSPDPITVTSARQVDPQQLNLYSYVRNNPLTLTDPTGMIINTDDLNDKDKALWAQIAALANKQNADGSYVNPTLHSAYSALDSDSRTFRIEDDKSLGASTAGRFEITKFNGPNDFSEAKVELNFGVIKDMTSTTPGNYDSSFQKYDGLFGKNGFLMRLTETFGHEASHGVFAINDPAQGSNIQRLVNDAHGAMNGVKYPVPPDVLQKVTNMNKALEPTERFAQQQEKIINKELQQKQ